jgi:transcription antitermination factor NusG
VQELEELVNPKIEPNRAVINSGYRILRVQPSLEIGIAAELNYRKLSTFCPEEYRLIRTNKVENGRRIRVPRPVAMITGYIFVQLQDDDEWRERRGHEVRGVGKFLQINGKPAGLRNSEIEQLHAVHVVEVAKYEREIARRAAEAAAKLSGKPTVAFEAGKQVRVDGPTGEPWIATMLQERGSRRVQVMVDNAKIIVEHSRIHEIESAA